MDPIDFIKGAVHLIVSFILRGENMKKENVLFLLLAIITVLCIMSIGVAIAERSPLIAVFAIIGAFIATGIGFSLRKKLRESGELQ